MIDGRMLRRTYYPHQIVGVSMGEGPSSYNGVDSAVEVASDDDSP